MYFACMCLTNEQKLCLHKHLYRLASFAQDMNRSNVVIAMYIVWRRLVRI